MSDLGFKLKTCSLKEASVAQEIKESCFGLIFQFSSLVTLVRRGGRDGNGLKVTLTNNDGASSTF